MIKPILLLTILLASSSSAKFLTSTNIWFKTGCIAENIKSYEHYICDKYGQIRCLPGYTNEANDCKDPICNPPCFPGRGNCTLPNVCSCEVGWTGQDCSKCICIPGCVNGNCTNAFECNCFPGWKGLYCDIPICREGCVNGICFMPGECHCLPGWSGVNCTECVKLPGCTEYGYCTKPLECKCLPGWTGSFCHIPQCSVGCNATNGYCYKPNECWCRIGWTGPRCDTCIPYPGCQQGTCSRPWECNCNPGYAGKLCDRRDTDPTTTSGYIRNTTTRPIYRFRELPGADGLDLFNGSALDLSSTPAPIG